MRKEYYFVIILVLLIGGLFGFGSEAGLALQAALRGEFPQPAAGNLTAAISDRSWTGGAGGALQVQVYSQYPLNLKNELSIAAGSEDGIAAGDIAMVNGYVLGVVEETFEHSALVRTIFDKRFQAPVRIGAAGVDALLRGGSEPELALIPGNTAIGDGDGVYAVADGMPYGAPIGAMKGLRDADDRVFRQAQVSVPYNPGALRELTILPSSKK